MKNYIFTQPPSQVQPITMSIFMRGSSPYDPILADEETQQLKEKLIFCGMTPVSFFDILAGKTDIEITHDHLIELAQKSITLPADKIEEINQVELIYNLKVQSKQNIAKLIIHQPSLILIPDDKLQNISPDSMYENYNIQPLFGLMFPRDHFIKIGNTIVMGELIRKDRRRESSVVETVIKAMNRTPVIFSGNLEGGDYTENEKVSIINIGYRTSKEILPFILKNDLINNKEFLLVIEDLYKNPNQFHLDHYFCLGENLVLVDGERCNNINMSSVQIYKFNGKEWKKSPKIYNILEALKTIGISYITLNTNETKNFSANGLFIKNQLIISNKISQSLRKQIANYGIEIHAIPFNEHHKQFGSIHCSTQIS